METVSKCKSSLIEQIKDRARPNFGEITVSDPIGSYVDENTTHIDLWIYTDALNINIGFDFDNASCIIKDKPKPSIEPQSNVLAIGDFIRNADGTIKRGIKLSEAAEACIKLGSRLPTSRELAKYAEKYGGKIIEVNEYEADKIPTGYAKKELEIFESENMDGKNDRFFYSDLKYKRPKGDLGKYMLHSWRSSQSKHLQIFDSVTGRLLSFGQSSLYDSDIEDLPFKNQAARCVVK